MIRFISISFILSFCILFTACTSYQIPENIRYDYTTRGPLTNDVFQVIVTAKPEKNTLTQSDQRESAYIAARTHSNDECVKQMMDYYISEKKSDISEITPDTQTLLINKFKKYASDAVIEQQYYLPDNSVVFIIRIYVSDIKNKIINN